MSSMITSAVQNFEQAREEARDEIQGAYLGLVMMDDGHDLPDSERDILRRLREAETEAADAVHYIKQAMAALQLEHKALQEAAAAKDYELRWRMPLVKGTKLIWEKVAFGCSEPVSCEDMFEVKGDILQTTGNYVRSAKTLENRDIVLELTRAGEQMTGNRYHGILFRLVRNGYRVRFIDFDEFEGLVS